MECQWAVLRGTGILWGVREGSRRTAERRDSKRHSQRIELKVTNKDRGSEGGGGAMAAQGHKAVVLREKKKKEEKNVQVFYHDRIGG